MDQGDWKTDLLSLDPSPPERPAEQSPQKFEEEIIPFKTLKTLENLKQATGQI